MDPHCGRYSTTCSRKHANVRIFPAPLTALRPNVKCPCHHVRCDKQGEYLHPQNGWECQRWSRLDKWDQMRATHQSDHCKDKVPRRHMASQTQDLLTNKLLPSLDVIAVSKPKISCLPSRFWSQLQTPISRSITKYWPQFATGAHPLQPPGQALNLS